MAYQTRDYKKSLISHLSNSKCGKIQSKKRCFPAKIRCTGAEEKLPLINIFHFDGKFITLENANKVKVV